MKKAFTLAEVLITLMIIGIVAALTVPSVISNYQQQEFKTGLKKAVSVLNEAIQMNIQEDGETPYDSTNIYDYFRRKMSLVQANIADFRIKQDSVDNKDVLVRNMSFYTTDGMRFEFNWGGFYKELHLHESDVTLRGEEIRGYTLGGCGSYGLAANPNNTKNPPCVVLVDVNGDKKPNPNIIPEIYEANGVILDYYYSEKYLYPSPNDKKLTDIYNILITDEKAIPFGVVAQRAMYSK